MAQNSPVPCVTFEVPGVPVEEEPVQAPPETDAEVPPPAEENKETQSKTSEEKTETKTPEKSTTGKKKSKKKSFKTTSGGKGRSGAHIDILGTVAMENALFICHNAQDLLAWRGYPWPHLQGKPGGKKK